MQPILLQKLKELFRY